MNDLFNNENEAVDVEDVKVAEVTENCLDEVTDEFIKEVTPPDYKPLDDIIKEYPNGVTINGCFAMKDQNDKIKPALKFAEDPERYFYGSSGDLGKLFDRWTEYCGGDESKVNQFLAEKPQYIRIYKVKMKNGNGKYVKVAKGIKTE